MGRRQHYPGVNKGATAFVHVRAHTQYFGFLKKGDHPGKFSKFRLVISGVCDSKAEALLMANTTLAWLLFWSCGETDRGWLFCGLCISDALLVNIGNWTALVQIRWARVAWVIQVERVIDQLSIPTEIIWNTIRACWTGLQENTPITLCSCMRM